MLFSVEQAFVGREEIRAPLKMPAGEARAAPALPISQFPFVLFSSSRFLNSADPTIWAFY